MAVITGATVTFTDYSAPGTPRLLHVPDAWGDVTAQDVWDTLSEIEAELDNLIYKKLVDRPKSGGKNVLSASKQVGISIVMNNNKIKFPDQPGPSWVIKRAIDGNITAIDHLEADMEALENSNFTNWKNEADVSAAIVETGVSGLTTAESTKLDNIDTNTAYHTKIINGVKELKKIGSSWYLIIYDTGEVSGGVEILRKKQTDKDGNDITDLVAGVLAAELENSV